MTFQPGANNYAVAFGTNPENVEVPHLDVRAPAVTDILYPIGKRWIDSMANEEWVLTSLSTSGNTTTATWVLSATINGTLDNITGNSGGPIAPDGANNINVVGSGQIGVTGAGNTLTVSLTGPASPTTYTAHGVIVGEGTSPLVATAAGTNGQILVGATGADPAFATLTSTGSTMTVTGGANTLNIDVTAPLNVAHGGTGDTTLTAHGVLVGEGTSAVAALAVGTTGQVLIGSSAADPAFGALGVNSGLTAHGVLLGENNSAIVATAAGATGQALMGATGADPAFTSSPSFAGSVTAATTITATLGAITATNGNLVMGTAGNKIIVPTGANASVGVSAAMSGTPGAVTVATTASSATAKVFYSRATAGGVLGNVSITAQDGTGFTLTSTATETSTFNWWIINA